MPNDPRHLLGLHCFIRHGPCYLPQNSIMTQLCLRLQIILNKIWFSIPKEVKDLIPSLFWWITVIPKPLSPSEPRQPNWSSCSGNVSAFLTPPVQHCDNAIWEQVQLQPKMAVHFTLAFTVRKLSKLWVSLTSQKTTLVFPQTCRTKEHNIRRAISLCPKMMRLWSSENF